MLEAGLIASRFLHYAALLLLFGAALYPLYGGDKTAIATLRLRPFLTAMAALALLSLLSWFLFAAAGMAGDIGAIANTSVLGAVLNTTDFGQLWSARLIVNLTLLIFLLLGRTRFVLLLAALLLASLAGTGHALEPPQARSWHVASDAIHLLAAGAWLGGLWPLARALGTERQPAQTAKTLLRFSMMGQGAVALLLVSGLINGRFLIGTPAGLMASLYGALLAAKILLFAAMVSLAALNRFWIGPRLNAADARDRAAWLGRLRRHVVAEQLLGFAVLAIVAWLGTLNPISVW